MKTHGAANLYRLPSPVYPFFRHSYPLTSYVSPFPGVEGPPGEVPPVSLIDFARP